MSGTKAGGLKTAATNKEKYGPQFYVNIGRKGGQNGHTGGFAANPELAKIAGRKGGQISRRGPAKPKTPEERHKAVEAYRRQERKLDEKIAAKRAELKIHENNIRALESALEAHKDEPSHHQKGIRLWMKLFKKGRV